MFFIFILGRIIFFVYTWSDMSIGTIALDIDGTITDQSHLIPDEVASFFEELFHEGWHFIFVTGRPLSYTLRTLPKLCFPYSLGVQNGSVLLEMPEKKEVGRAYLSMDLIKEMDRLHKGFEGDFLVYSGYETGDFCYFRPSHFSEEMLSYLKKVEKVSDAPWVPLSSFDEMNQSEFPLIKCVGKKKEMETFNQKLKHFGEVKTTLIKDPLSETLYLLLITHKEADKGIAVKKLMKKKPLITGGNDNNDIPLLQEGCERIAIEGSPKELLSLATIVAPPSEKMGIIDALKEALRRLK
ncbi:MAG: HAD family phosphatase [Chlamydiia bacterium]|nr:HAD family phosphatase [Chlamydiia bacterium]